MKPTFNKFTHENISLDIAQIHRTNEYHKQINLHQKISTVAHQLTSFTQASTNKKLKNLSVSNSFKKNYLAQPHSSAIRKFYTQLRELQKIVYLRKQNKKKLNPVNHQIYRQSFPFSEA